MTHFAFVESNTTGTGRRAVERLLAEGERVTFLTRSRGKYPFLAEPHPGLVVLDVETNDVDEVVRVLREIMAGEQVDAVLTFSDFYVDRVAEAARRLGFPGLDPAAAATCRSKHATRLALARAGLPTPEFRLLASEEDALLAAADIGFPAVVKPIADSSSTGVRRVDDAAELLAQFRALAGWQENVRGQKLDGHVLVEGFLAGSEHSVETFTLPGGETRVLGVTDKHLSPPPHFVETGHDFPSGVPPERRAALEAAALAALAAVGFDFGPAHTELRLTELGPVVVEINARLAGGMIPELVALSSGVDLSRAWLELAAGREPALEPSRSGFASIRFLTAPARGRLLRVEGEEEARAVSGVVEVLVTARPGAGLAPAEDAYGRLGHAIAAGPEREAVAAAAEAGARAVRFVLEPEPIGS